MFLEEQDILLILKGANPWWVTSTVNSALAPEFKRKQFKRVCDIFLNPIRRFPILSGPRRVGKSTIMFQVIDMLLKKGVKPSSILFFTLDEYPNDGISVKEAVRVFKKYVYPDDDFYLFIDEAQKDETWKDYVKTIFDLNKSAHVMVSGSSSVEIERKSGESGSARFYTVKIPTLSFYEFCLMNGKEVPLEDIDVFSLHKLPIEEQSLIHMKLSSLYPELIRYMKVGGFPEYATSLDYGYIGKLIRDQVVVKAIRQDIPKSFGIRDADALSDLYTYICFHSSDILNVDSISKAIEIDRATVNMYIDALEKANLIYISESLSLSGKKALKPKRKVYVSDYGIRTAVTRKEDIETDVTEMGLAIETVALKHTKDYFQSLDESYNVGFSRNEKGQEIDIVIQESLRDIQYVEAKYRENSRIKDSDGIVVYGLADIPGYVVTKDPNDFGLSIRGHTSLYRIPALTYFYLLGRNAI